MKSPHTSLQLYKKLFLLRATEEAIVRRYEGNGMKTPMHMSMGSEAIAAGVCAALQPEDPVLSSYRSHAPYLAKTGETKNFFAELYGKVTGGAKGRAGSMHLSYPEKGYLGASAVVATPIPVALGVAFAGRAKKAYRTTAVFFGDGAVDEGVFWESLNVACLWKLPVMFVCEDNDLAIHIPKSKRRGYRSLTDVVSKFNCSVYESDTTDVEKIFKIAKKAITGIQKTKQPAFLNLRYHRYLEHVGIHEDFQAGYRSKKDFQEWVKRDPIKLQRDRLRAMGVTETNFQKVEQGIIRRIERSIRAAERAPFAKTRELYTDIFPHQS